MKILQTSVLSVATIIALSFSISGCGSSSGGSSEESKDLTGTFIDAPVEGLKYKTTSSSGLTDYKGTVTYKADDTCTFYIGTLLLGSQACATLMTPYGLAGDTDINNPSQKAKNIARILQSLNISDSNDTLKLNSNVVENFVGTDINISSNDINMTLVANRAHAHASDIDFISKIKTEEEALNVMKTYITSNHSTYLKPSTSSSSYFLSNLAMSDSPRFKTSYLTSDNSIYLIESITDSSWNETIQIRKLDSSYNMVNTFGTNGVLTLDASYSSSGTMAIDSDDNIYLLVGETANSEADGKLLKILVSGAVDTSFGTSGLYSLAGYNPLNIAIKDDKIYLTGSKTVVATYDKKDLFVSKHGLDGVLVSGFGTSGIFAYDIDGIDTNQVTDTVETGIFINVGSDDKLYIAGLYNHNDEYSTLLLKMNSTNGTLDTGFDTDGAITIPAYTLAGQQILTYPNYFTTDSANNLWLQVRNGNATEGSKDTTMYKYSSSGVLDTNFGTDGKYLLNAYSGANFKSTMDKANNKMYIVGKTTSGSMDETLLSIDNTGTQVNIKESTNLIESIVYNPSKSAPMGVERTNIRGKNSYKFKKLN